MYRKLIALNDFRSVPIKVNSKLTIVMVLFIGLLTSCSLYSMPEPGIEMLGTTSLDSLPIELQQYILELALLKIFKSSAPFGEIFQEGVQLLQDTGRVNKRFRSFKRGLVVLLLEHGHRYFSFKYHKLSQSELNLKLEMALKGNKTPEDLKEALQAVFAGANPNLLVNTEVGMPRSVLSWACLWPSCELTLLLLLKGAKINYQNRNGYSALMQAASQGFEDIVKILLNHKADTTLKSKGGQTALLLAQKENKHRVIELLS